jgi:hypothetical protein
MKLKNISHDVIHKADAREAPTIPREIPKTLLIGKTTMSKNLI